MRREGKEAWIPLISHTNCLRYIVDIVNIVFHLAFALPRPQFLRKLCDSYNGRLKTLLFD